MFWQTQVEEPATLGSCEESLEFSGTIHPKRPHRMIPSIQTMWAARKMPDRCNGRHPTQKVAVFRGRFPCTIPSPSRVLFLGQLEWLSGYHHGQFLRISERDVDHQWRFQSRSDLRL